MNPSHAPSHRTPAGLTLATLLALACLLAALPASAQQVPDKMTFQGFLTDAGTPPVPLGNTAPVNKNVTFTIYDAATGGVVQWAESQIVTVDKGHFSVLLGEGTQEGSPLYSNLRDVFSAADAANRYLGITVDGSEITPRIRFYPAPYSHIAGVAGALATGATAEDLTASGTVNSGTINAGTVNSGVLLMGNSLGNSKIMLWESDQGPGQGYGIGVQDNQFRLHLNSFLDRFSFLDGPNGNELMTIKGGTPRVGIGTTNPEQSLDVNGVITLFDGAGRNHPAGISTELDSQLINIGVNDGRFGTISQAQQGGFIRLDTRQSESLIQFYGRDRDQDNAQRRMVMTAGGYLGIGVDTPRALLHIKQQGAATSPGLRVPGNQDPSFGIYMGSRAATLSWGGAVPNAGDNQTLAYGALSAIFEGELLASQNVWVGNAANYFSDARAKRVLGESDPQRDLAILKELSIKDYVWIDKARDQHRPHKKLLAQEVEQVFPQAVELVPGETVIPSIYAPASGIHYEADQALLRLTTAMPHQLETGDSVDIYTNVSPLKQVEVVEVSGEHDFVVACDHAPEGVFVYGKYVDDFRAIDYEAIAMLNVSATQEIARKTESLQERIRALDSMEREISVLKDKASRVDQLERELADLKDFVAALANSRNSTTDSDSLLASRSAADQAGE